MSDERSALVVVDMLNAYDHEDAERLTASVAEKMGIRHLVLVGQVTEQCILYSALDAYVRELRVTVPSDGVAHIHDHLADAALEMMEINMDAEICPSSDCEMYPGGRDGGG